MPLNKLCHICHGDPDTVSICSACFPDLDMAFSLIWDLQRRLRYFEDHFGHRATKLDVNDISPESVLAIPKETKITFDEVIDLVDGRSLQSVFRQIDDATLAGVLYSLQTVERVEKIKKNVSKNHFDRLMDYINEGYFGTVVERLEPHREKFMNNVRMLEEMGEIVVARRDNEESHEFRYVSGPTIDWEKYRQDQKKQLEEQDRRVKEWKIKVGLEKPNE